VVAKAIAVSWVTYSFVGEYGAFDIESTEVEVVRIDAIDRECPYVNFGASPYDWPATLISLAVDESGPLSLAERLQCPADRVLVELVDVNSSSPSSPRAGSTSTASSPA
jgi:hypothetical protein